MNQLTEGEEKSGKVFILRFNGEIRTWVVKHSSLEGKE